MYSAFLHFCLDTFKHTCVAYNALYIADMLWLHILRMYIAGICCCYIICVYTASLLATVYLAFCLDMFMHACVAYLLLSHNTLCVYCRHAVATYMCFAIAVTLSVCILLADLLLIPMVYHLFSSR